MKSLFILLAVVLVLYTGGCLCGQSDSYSISSVSEGIMEFKSEAHDGYSRVVMDSNGKNNPRGVVHGGAIFALADQAFGIAANCGAAIRIAVSIHIQYIAPATGSLVAVAHRVADNGRYSTFRVMVYEEERIIAEFDGVAIQVNTPLQ